MGIAYIFCNVRFYGFLEKGVKSIFLLTLDWQFEANLFFILFHRDLSRFWQITYYIRYFKNIPNWIFLKHVLGGVNDQG